jgi:hypothetical protein
MKSFIFGLIAALAVLVVAPVVHAQTYAGCSTATYGDGFGYYPCTPGRVHVYVQVNTFGYGAARQASDFTVTVSPRFAAPITFQGSAQGTTVSVAGSYTIAASSLSGYTSNYSLGCNGTISNGQEATCIITQNTYSPYGAYNYGYPYYTGDYSPYAYTNQGLSDIPPTVTLAQTAAPRLPNTGAAPLSAPMLALVVVVLSGLGLLMLPYVRKIITTIG